MNNNLSIIKELLITENTLCFSSINNKQLEFINRRNNFILNNKDPKSMLNFLECYNTDKIMKKLLMEESILLLEEFFLKTYAKKVLEYVKKLKIFKREAIPAVNKSGINTKKLKKDIQKIVVRKSKSIEKAVKSVDESSLKNQFKEISKEVTEYLNKMVGSFRKEYMSHAIIQYILLLSLEFLSTAIFTVVFTLMFGTVKIPSVLFNIVSGGVRSLISPIVLANIVTSICIIPFIEEDIKSDEIRIGKGSEFILVVSIGELIKKSIFYPFGLIYNILFGVFKVIATITTGFIHYYYNKKGKAGLGKFVATIVNSLGSIAIAIPTMKVSFKVINSIIDKKTV